MLVIISAISAVAFRVSATVDVCECVCCSFDDNQICGIDEYGMGTYTTVGIEKMSEMLKVNTTLQSIRCATVEIALALYQKRQQPLTPYSLF